MRQGENPENPSEISILICLSASPSNQRVIRSAARFARGRYSRITALYVDNGKNRPDNAYLLKNMELAGSFGASVETVVRKDVLGAIMEYAGNRGITDLFIGYSGPSNQTNFRHLPVYRLVRNLPDVDVHIIPDASVQLRPSDLDTGEQHRQSRRDLFRTVAVMADRKSTRLNSSHPTTSRMPSSA